MNSQYGKFTDPVEGPDEGAEMTRYSKRERVQAAVKMSFGPLSDVEEGEEGVVLDVEDPWVRETQYLVKFEGGVEGWVPESSLRPA